MRQVEALELDHKAKWAELREWAKSKMTEYEKDDDDVKNINISKSHYKCLLLGHYQAGDDLLTKLIELEGKHERT